MTSAVAADAPKKSASAEILDKVSGVHAALLGLHRLAALRYNPNDLRVYKPTKGATGTALSLDLRLDPVFEKTYVKKVGGGLFLVLAKQKPELDKNGNATFDWEKTGALTTKLGVVDVSKLLVAFDTVRNKGKKVPQFMRPKQEREGAEGAVVSLFHVFEGEEAKNTTGITVQFEADGIKIRVSRSKDDFRAIKLDLAEEYRFRRALERALDVLEELGVR